MTDNPIGALWKAALADPKLLGRVSEQIIERFSRNWVRPGHRALDVGAGIGRHFFPLAECVGPEGELIGFEPVQALSIRIEAEIGRREFGRNIRIETAAVSNKAGRAPFFEVTSAPALSGLRRRPELAADMQVRETETEVTTIDAVLGNDPVRFVKLDVQGGEFNAFRGATNTMLRSRPVFAFEDGRGSSAKSYGYTMAEFYDFFAGVEYQILDIFGFTTTIAMERYPGPWNFFAVPFERLEEAQTALTLANMVEVWSELVKTGKAA